MSEISKIVHETRKPIYLTKNGREDMVLMSMNAYQDMMEENETYL
ncbi:type II toxin-antitoxin system prevent-host-death family antitoxin [Longibaculum muris]